MYHNQGIDIYKRPARRTYIYMVSHTNAGKIVAVLLLWHLTNERTNARNARENEEEIADVELAISNTGIEATRHLRRKIPRKA